MLRSVPCLVLVSLLCGCGSRVFTHLAEPVALDVPSWLEARDCEASAELARSERRLRRDVVATSRAVASCRTLAEIPDLDLHVVVYEHPGLGHLLQAGRYSDAALGALDVTAGARALAHGGLVANATSVGVELRALDVLIAALPRLDAKTRGVVVSRIVELDRSFPPIDSRVDDYTPHDDPFDLKADYEERIVLADGYQGARASRRNVRHQLEDRWNAMRAVLATTAPVSR